MSQLLQELQALEVDLHHPGVRCSRERLEQLLHPVFHEVGRSGRSYNRETVIKFLAAQESQPLIESENFSATLLSQGAALLTYRSAHIEHGARLVHHTLRSSIWLKAATGWQMRYHQGTPAAETW